MGPPPSPPLGQTPARTRGPTTTEKRNSDDANSTIPDETTATIKRDTAATLRQQPCPNPKNSSGGRTTCECWFDYQNAHRIDLTETAAALSHFGSMKEAEQKQLAGRILREGEQYRNKAEGRVHKHKCFKITGLPHRICKGKLTKLLHRGEAWLKTAKRETDPGQANAPNPATLRSRQSSKRRKLAELLGYRGPIVHHWKQPLRPDALDRLQHMVRSLTERPDCDIGIERRETHFEVKENMGISKTLQPGKDFPPLHSYTTAQFIDESLLPDGEGIRLLADGILYKPKAQCLTYSEFPVLREIQNDTLASLRKTKARLFLGEAIRALPPAQGDTWDSILETRPDDPYSQMTDRSGDPFALSLAAMSLHVQGQWQVAQQSVYMPHIDIFGEFVCFVQIFGSSYTFISVRCDDPSVTRAYFDEQDDRDGATSWRDYANWKASLKSTDPAEHNKIAAYERELQNYINSEQRSRAGRLFRIRVYRLAPGRRLAFAAGT